MTSRSFETSPLYERVVFVEGVPRSGTTLLAALLSVHDEIAGMTSESRLFDQGVRSLIDTHEDEEHGAHLSAYVSRPQLIQLVRSLCDGVLLEMRTRAKPEARYVLEKSPVPFADARTVLQRKLECYPDASYIHIIRDKHAVASSLTRAPWNPDRS